MIALSGSGNEERFRIDIADEQDILSLDEDWLRTIARTVLDMQEVAEADVSVALIADALMHQLNRHHLEHDYPTDVLSFLLECDAGDLEEDLPAESVRGRGKRLEGEVILSTETAVREAAEAGWEASSEVALYLVHGLLHLCGYDDQEESERAEMRRWERLILQKWGLVPHYQD